MPVFLSVNFVDFGQVSKQTQDLVYLLRLAAGRAENYLFMEDDMRLCDAGIEAIKRILDKAKRCVECSYALRVVYVHCVCAFVFVRLRVLACLFCLLLSFFSYPG